MVHNTGSLEVLPNVNIYIYIYIYIYICINIYTNIKHVAMYPCTKFESIWRISDFNIKFVKKYEWKEVWKRNIKTVISI